jgi:uncharacterized protein DUF4242
MTDVFVERHWSRPLTEADMQAMMVAADGCLGIHRLTWCGSLLSTDGRDMFCHFRGPDAESVRIAMKLAGGSPGIVWACRVQDAPGIDEADLARVNVVARHRFDAPAEFFAPALREDVGPGGIQLHGARQVRSYLSVDRLRMICLYQAPDVESVRTAQHHAHLPADDLWAVRRYAPER